MISKENFSYATKNLMNRKLRSALTIISIFVGISTIFIFVSFGLGLFTYINDISSDIGTDKLIVQARGIGAPGSDDTFRLEESDIETLEKTRGVENAAAMAFTGAEVEKGDQTKYVYVVSLPVEDKDDLDLSMSLMTVDLMEGRNLDKGDDSRVVLGYRYTLENGVFRKPSGLGDKFTINDQDFTIVGIFEEIGNPSDDSNIYITEDAYKELTEDDNINYAMILAQVDDVSRIEEIRERAKKNMRKDRGLEEGKEDFFIQSAAQLIESFAIVLNIVVGFIILIAVISVVVSAINTANTMFTSILERTKEIGILKAIGAQNMEILTVFLLESSILGFLAGIIGIIVGVSLSYMGGVILDNLGWGFLKPSFPLVLFIGCLVFATLVGTISGMIPAFNASRQKPVDSLRYE